jgi:hypothetical protein
MFFFFSSSAPELPPPAVPRPCSALTLSRRRALKKFKQDDSRAFRSLKYSQQLFAAARQ